ncbi:MAG: DUF937 domain-containing protein [Pseudomonadota bacterium]
MLDHLRATRPDGAALAERGRALGLTAEQTEAIAGAIQPILTGKLEKRSLSRSGLADLMSLLGQADRDPQEQPDNLGTAALAELLGSRDSSRFLARRVARDTGVSDRQVKDLLPDIARQFVTGVAADTRPRMQQIFDAAPRSSDLPEQRPLPVPDSINDDSGYGRRARTRWDDVGDILVGGRDRSGQKQPQQQPRGGGLSRGGMGKTIRDALGGALGYRNQGIVGWIIRFIVMRYGWRILSSLVRAFFRR